jgi:hypothetical protein
MMDRIRREFKFLRREKQVKKINVVNHVIKQRGRITDEKGKKMTNKRGMRNV